MRTMRKWTAEDYYEVVEMRKNKKTWKEIARRFGVSLPAVNCFEREVRNGARVFPLKSKSQRTFEQLPEEAKQTKNEQEEKPLPAIKEVSEGGAKMFTDCVVDEETVEAAAKRFNVDLKEWEADRFLTNEWSMGYVDRGKDGKAVGKRMPLFQVKVWWKKRIINSDKFKELIEDIKKIKPDFSKAKIPTTAKDGRLLIVDLADIHFNKLSVAEETGEVYNLEIAQKRCIDGVEKLLAETSGYNISEIILVGGNDALHTDDVMAHGTTSGTPQDTVTRWWKAFRFAKAAYVAMLQRLAKVAPVHFVFCSSNHDRSSGFFLAECLEAYFNTHAGIKFTINPGARTYIKYGLNLLGFEHGDAVKKVEKHHDLMATIEPELWGATKFRYLYVHHIHHKERAVYTSKDHLGLTVEALRSPSSSDAWHAAKGYVQRPAVECFVHSPDRGQTSRHTVYFID
jgi:transposase-like protein